MFRGNPAIGRDRLSSSPTFPEAMSRPLYSTAQLYGCAMIDTGEFVEITLDELTEADWFDMARQFEPDISWADARMSWLEFNEFVRRKQLH